MKTCYKCKGQVKESRAIKEGVSLNCLKCTNCKEEYFTSIELKKFCVLSKN